MGVITFKTSQPAGDMLSVMPSLRQLYKTTGKKCVVFQSLNINGQGMHNIPQPFKDENGDSVMMSEQTFQNLKPLIESQEYIESYLPFTGQEYTYDLDEMRLKTFCNQEHGSIHRYLWYCFPEMACDLSKRWLYIEFSDEEEDEILPKYFDKVVINFSSRYRNSWVNYFFLKKYESRLTFAGLPDEHKQFCKKWNLEIPLLEFRDFHHLGMIIKSCEFFLGNQSMMFQIAEGMKVKRLLETSQIIPNVIPMGEDGFDFYHQQCLEFYFNKLINS